MAPRNRRFGENRLMSRTGGEERKGKLISQAISMFGRSGFENTTLDAVAEAAGVRKQTLLYYFPSKDDLFESCVEELSTRLLGTLEKALEGDQLGWDRVEAIIRSIFRMAEQWPELPLFLREAARRSPQIVQRIAGEMEPLRKRAIQYLERGMDEGLFSKQDPGLLLFTLYTAVVGSLTEAGVLRAVAGGASGRTALGRREEELVQFVRRALEP